MSGEGWIDLGGVECRRISGGRFSLDAGGMFGIIPRALWSRRHQTDEAGRVELESNCLLVRMEGAVLLIDTGMGGKMGEREHEIFRLPAGEPLLEGLEEAGISPGDITHLLLTHLHMDHAGGASRMEAGTPRLVFPRAEVVVQRREWQDAGANRSHMTATYRPENLAPLAESGRLRLLDGPSRIQGAVRLYPTPGHCRGHQSVLIRGQRQALFFSGDVTPMADHLRPTCNTAFDTEPVRSIATKRKWLQRAAREGWWWCFSHESAEPLIQMQPGH